MAGLGFGVGVRSASPAPGRAVAAGEGLHCGDMQIRYEHPALAIGQGHEQLVSHDGDGQGVSNVIVLAAGELNAEGLEEVAVQQLAHFGRVHTIILAAGRIVSRGA